MNTPGRRIVWRAALIWLAAVIFSGAASAQQWQEFRAPGAGYRIEFPGQPKLEAQDVKTAAGAIRMNMAVVEAGAVLFLSIHSDFPPAAIHPDPQKALDGARDGGVRNVSGQLREEQRVSVDGAPARRFIIDVPQKGQVSLTLVVLSGNALYSAVYVGPPGSETSPDAQRFVASLRLVPR